MLKFRVSKGVQPDREDLHLTEKTKFKQAIRTLMASSYNDPLNGDYVTGFVDLAGKRPAAVIRIQSDVLLIQPYTHTFVGGAESRS
jgi:hypothetical protein